MIILDGKKIAEKVRKKVKREILISKQKIKLAVILVGSNPASEVYIKMKKKACKEAGIGFKLVKIDEKKAELAYLKKQCLIKKNILKLNQDKTITGIILQLPITPKIDEKKLCALIDKKKDVDCLNPFNIGWMVIKRGKLAPCTPKGCLRLIEEVTKEIRGKNAVIIGRSEIVGKPIAQLLLNKDATVSICHRHTNNLKDFTQKADILLVATGCPNLIRGNMIKKGAIVIDVGINRTKEGLVGDVCFNEAKKRVTAITPVPGGVGPMTIAMILENLLICKKLQKK